MPYKGLTAVPEDVGGLRLIPVLNIYGDQKTHKPDVRFLPSGGGGLGEMVKSEIGQPRKAAAVVCRSKGLCIVRLT